MNRAAYISIIIVFISGVFGNILRYSTHPPEGVADFGQIPMTLDGYSGREQILADFTYDILKADTTTYRDYTDPDGRGYNLFIAYFESQKYGSQIHSPKHCLPGGGWRIEQVVPRKIRLTDSVTREVNLAVISVQNYKAVMLYWFETRSGGIRSEYGLKLDLVKNSLLFNATDAAIVRLTVPISGDNLESALAGAEKFLGAFYPYIAQSLPF
jgi:EpsI family protein